MWIRRSTEELLSATNQKASECPKRRGIDAFALCGLLPG